MASPAALTHGAKKQLLYLRAPLWRLTVDDTERSKCSGYVGDACGACGDGYTLSWQPVPAHSGELPDAGRLGWKASRNAATSACSRPCRLSRAKGTLQGLLHCAMHTQRLCLKLLPYLHLLRVLGTLILSKMQRVPGCATEVVSPRDGCCSAVNVIMWQMAGASDEDLFNGCACRTLRRLWQCRWPPRCWGAWRSSCSSRSRCCWWRAASAASRSADGAACKKAAPLPIIADARSATAGATPPQLFWMQAVRRLGMPRQPGRHSLAVRCTVHGHLMPSDVTCSLMDESGHSGFTSCSIKYSG